MNFEMLSYSIQITFNSSIAKCLLFILNLFETFFKLCCCLKTLSEVDFHKIFVGSKKVDFKFLYFYVNHISALTLYPQKLLH